ncbi:MAG: hypothetical protein MRY63_13535 [Neomegalonema sp.]|nr:hypothetical protein [Neomegalonema sp.]
MAEAKGFFNRAPGPERLRRASCVIIGPTSAGKSTLLASLRRHANDSHSFLHQFAVEVIDPARSRDLKVIRREKPSKKDMRARRAERRNLADQQASARSGQQRNQADNKPESAGGLLARVFGGKRNKADLPPVPLAPAGGAPLDDAIRAHEGDAVPNANVGSPGTASASDQQDQDEEKAISTFSMYESRIEAGLHEGLVGQGTTADQLYPTRFDVSVRALERMPGMAEGQVLTARFRTVDSAGGLLLNDKTGRENPELRARLHGEILDAETVILCLPAAGFGADSDSAERRSLLDVLQWIRGLPQGEGPSRLIVLLTKFEAVVADFGRQAYRTAAHGESCRALIGTIMQTNYAWLLSALESFDQTPGRALWVQPVSAFGFVPFNGGANVSPHGDTLLTRIPKQKEVPGLLSPYTRKAVLDYYWRPFLIIDPFVFVATGEPGALTFAWEEVTETIAEIAEGVLAVPDPNFDWRQANA